MVDIFHYPFPLYRLFFCPANRVWGHIVPFFCEDKELAGYYLNEVRTMWDVEMGEEQDLSM